jgi:hypothetical protein
MHCLYLWPSIRWLLWWVFVDHWLTQYILYLKQDYHLVVNAVHCCSLLSNILPQYIVFSCLCQDITMYFVLETLKAFLSTLISKLRKICWKTLDTYTIHISGCVGCVTSLHVQLQVLMLYPQSNFSKSVLPWLDLKQFLWWSLYGFIFDLFWNHISHSVTSSEINNVVMKFILSHAELYWSVAFWELHILDDGKTFRWYPRSYWVINTTIGRSTASGKTWIIFKKTSSSHVGSKSWHMRGVEMGR